MKTFDLKDSALHSEKGEFLLGFRDTRSHACYMIYGTMRPGEKGRQVKPGTGHEEIILAAKGDLEVTGFYSGTLKEGLAFLIQGDQECLLENTGESDAVYIVAGGHSEVDSH